MKASDGRVTRLRMAKAKIKERLGALTLLQGRSSKARRLRARLAEFATSLQNIERYGQEHVPDGRPVGASVQAP